MAHKLFYILFAAILVAVNILAMPREFYAGDSTAVKLSAINLVKTGSFGIDLKYRPALAGLLEKKGEMFREDEARGKFISRWGWFNTALFAIPVLFQENISFPGDIGAATRAHNWFNVVLAACAGFYLLLLAQEFCASRWLAAGFVLACLYGTFAWNYLRAQSYDLLHLLLFLALCFHWLKYLSGRPRVHGSAWKLCLLALVLSKGFYLVLFPPLFLACWIQARRTGAGRDARSRAFRELAGILALALSVTLLGNYLQFGSILDFGIGKHYDVEYTPTWSARYLWPNFYHYYLSPENSVFLYFPPLLLALAGWRDFLRRSPGLAWFLFASAAVTFLVLEIYFSQGGWCYGPRFWLYLLPALALPGVSVLVKLVERRDARSLGVLGLCGLVLVFSVVQQLRVNRHPFFLKFMVQGLFWSYTKDPVVDDYFYHYPLPLQNREIEQFEAGEPGFFPAEQLIDTYPREKLAPLLRFLREKTAELDSVNYQWF